MDWYIYSTFITLNTIRLPTEVCVVPYMEIHIMHSP